MNKAGVDSLVVRSTDRFLNEYVPTDDSARVWISGFTGSMGEVVVTKDRAYLAVDGRYWIQAAREVDPKYYEVLRVSMGGFDNRIGELLRDLATAQSGKYRVGFEPDRLTPGELAFLEKTAGARCDWKPLFPSPVEVARGGLKPSNDEKIRLVDERSVGRTVRQKLQTLTETLETLKVDGLLVQRLDEIAYLSNLRGSDFPFQATFRALALVTRDTLFIGMDPAKAPNALRVARDAILFMPESELWTLIGHRTKRKRVAYDPSGTTLQAKSRIEKSGAEAVPITTPIAAMKSKKNRAELAAMAEAFRRADQVVAKAIRWLCDQIKTGNRVTEWDFSQCVESFFMDAGANALSFKIISAAGKNGAIIHYSDPSKRRVIKRGELMLLDTGAYFEEGYATDLTRTFLADGASARGTQEQRRYYTLVLKAAVAGMKAIVPAGAQGSALDAIVRAPMWAAGLNYNHGTGHGVGINVHEYPPRIAPGSASVLEEGQIFSIEPGIYIPSFGGVRIENLCTLTNIKGRPGFLQVEPLSFSPLDTRLFERSLLTSEEKVWLAAYGKKHRAPPKAKPKTKTRRKTKAARR